MGLFSDAVDIGKGLLGKTPAGQAFSFAEGALEDPFGTQAQVDALRAAGRMEEADRLESRALLERILGETEGTRERADIAGQRLLDIADTPISESEDFQRDLREALSQQQLGLSAFGLGEGTTQQLTTAETTSRALTAERGKKTNILQFLAGGAEAGFSGSLGARGIASNAALSGAQTQAGIGQAIGFGRRALTDLLVTAGTTAAFA